MKKEPLIIIKLMISNYTNQLSQELINIIEKRLSKEYPGIIVELLNTEIYWKIQDLMICYIGVFCDKIISVQDILNHVTTSSFWYKKENLEEEAVWDLKINGGILINQNIKWAHIYTWATNNIDKKP